MVDTNVLVDLREIDPIWHEWSFRAVGEARMSDSVVTSAVTIGELATRGGTLADLQAFSGGLGIRILPLSVAAAYRAGQAQRAYRASGGKREKLLADFLIGGEADVPKARLLTRDPRHYRSYFPDLTLITPETDA